jgi:energy-coupling factor transporter ATP-binding protein EcfA2
MPANIERFESELLMRLRRREHLVLYGPQGSGKSALLARLHARIAQTGTPCALSSRTSSLGDITRALERAYPHVDTAAKTRRAARARLVLAADDYEGVLLLGCVWRVNNQMLGLLRRLRGGIAGVLLAMDVDVERDRQRLPGRHLGMSWLPMPLATARQLRKLFRAYCANYEIPGITADQEGQIVRAARGRPGWIVQCACLIAQSRYWRDATFYVSVLCTDTEIALRQGNLRLLPPEVDTVSGPGMNN